MFAPSPRLRVVVRFGVVVQRADSVLSFCGWIVAAVAVLFAREGHAQEPLPVPVHVDYRAVTGCPGEERFLRRLLAHTQRLQRSTAPDALQLEVHVMKRGDGFVGRLRVSRGTEALGTRQFEDANCAEVVAALALSAALSIDPEAKLDAQTDLESTDSENRDGAVNETGQDLPEAPATETVRPGEPPPELTPAPPSSGPSEPRTWYVSVGPEFVAGLAFEPKAALGFGVSMALHRVPDRTWFPLDASVSFDYLSTRPTRGNEPLRIDWYTFRAGYCPLRAGGDWALLACAVGNGGWLSVQGVSVDEPRNAKRSFASLGLGLRTRAKLGTGWFLHAEFDLGVPLSDRSFAIDPDSQIVASSRPVGGVFGVGVRRAF